MRNSTVHSMHPHIRFYYTCTWRVLSPGLTDGDKTLMETLDGRSIEVARRRGVTSGRKCRFALHCTRGWLGWLQTQKCCLLNPRTNTLNISFLHARADVSDTKNQHVVAIPAKRNFWSIFVARIVGIIVIYHKIKYVRRIWIHTYVLHVII